MRNRVRAVPAWAWVGAIVAVSTVVRFAFARHMVGAVDHDRRDRLLRAREELRGDGIVRGSRGADRRLRRRLPDPDQPGLRAVPFDPHRLQRGQIDQRAAHVAHGRSCVPARPPCRLDARSADRRRARRRSPVHVLCRHRHDGERVLSGLRAARPGARRAARAPTARHGGVLSRCDRPCVRDTRAGRRRGARRAARAVADRSSGAPTARAPPLQAALRRSRRNRRARRPRGGRARPQRVVAPRCLRRGDALVVRRRDGVEVAPLAPLRASAVCRRRSRVRSGPTLRPGEGVVERRARGRRRHGVARCVPGRRGRSVRVAAERAPHRRAQSLLRCAPALHVSRAVDRARHAPAPRCDRGGRGGSRCAGGGRSVRAVHRHVGDLGHVRRARALVDRGSGCTCLRRTFAGWSQGRPRSS